MGVSTSTCTIPQSQRRIKWDNEEVRDGRDEAKPKTIPMERRTSEGRKGTRMNKDEEDEENMREEVLEAIQEKIVPTYHVSLQ